VRLRLAKSKRYIARSYGGDRRTIRMLLRSNEVPVQDIAAQFKVNRSTLYRNMTASIT
jgi:DNA invertase Pin-like site-specific DNA recombinase